MKIQEKHLDPEHGYQVINHNKETVDLSEMLGDEEEDILVEITVGFPAFLAVVVCQLELVNH